MNTEWITTAWNDYGAFILVIGIIVAIYGVIMLKSWLLDKLRGLRKKEVAPPIPPKNLRRQPFFIKEKNTDKGETKMSEADIDASLERIEENMVVSKSYIDKKKREIEERAEALKNNYEQEMEMLKNKWVELDEKSEKLSTQLGLNP